MWDARTGRGANVDPANRFARYRTDVGDLEDPPDPDDEARAVRTEFLPDASRSIVSENSSPDIPFRYSVNPYRGCEHGCSYCYARPYHEFLGLNAGLDFEAKIFVKHRAPELLTEWLERDNWTPELIAFSGVTDCYQPAEKRFELTRRCLEVTLQARLPVGLITKNAIILRDLDLLAEMAERRLVHVAISLTTLDEQFGRQLEPRTSRPAARLRAIRELSAAGVPVRVMTAPVIPGLNDAELPALLAAAADAGAQAAGYTILRLPLAVKPIFLDWLERYAPSKKSRVESWLRELRGGELNTSNFGERMRGSGLIADQIAQTYKVFCRKHGLDRKLPELDFSQFTPPTPKGGQLRLF